MNQNGQLIYNVNARGNSQSLKKNTINCDVMSKENIENENTMRALRDQNALNKALVHCRTLSPYRDSVPLSTTHFEV